jgi:hypothetical protein
VHVVELVLLVVAVLLTLASLLRGLVSEESPDGPHPWVLDDLLFLGVLGSISTYAYLATTGSYAEARYLSAGIIYAVILCARLLGRNAVTLRPTIVNSVIVRRFTGAIACVISLAIVAGGIFTTAKAEPRQPATSLVNLLRTHHLTTGIGGYWSASITTVLSNDEITVRPVTTDPNGRVVRYARESLDTWYRHRPEQFLVYDADPAVDSITRKFARTTFGPALHVYSVGPYRVLVYRHPIYVSVHGYSS